MKSHGYRDVQHTGLQSTQTRRNKVHKQGALGTSSQASLHQWLHCMSKNQTFFNTFCDLELISISYNYYAVTEHHNLCKKC